MVVFDDVRDDDDLGSSSSVVPSKKQPHIDLTHFQSLPRVLKIVQWVLVIFLQNLARPFLLSFVAELTFILTSAWLLVYAFSVHKKYSITIPWIVLEFYYTVGAASMFLITTLVTFAYLTFLPAAIFGFFTTVAYGTEALFLLRLWMEWRATQAGFGGQGQGSSQDISGVARSSSGDYTNRQTLKV